ncbi:MAG: hypothetical protein L0211_21895 [Planctomycetaceae bacterium]|nr:hypothetical protein [Planctomycetaceae bacterium]
MATVRKLTDVGIASFTDYLKRVSEGEALEPPTHLLFDSEASEALLGTAEVEQVVLDTKLMAAKYLQRQLASLDRIEVDNSVGLWTWLSLYFFEQLCPASANGRREPGELVRHVLSPFFKKYYRHLLGGPCRLLQLHGEFARVFLYGPLPEHGDFSEQLASRMQIITNRALIEAVDRLYFDAKAEGGGRPKRGALTRSRAGNLRRLVAVIQQFDLTYDLYAMSADEIIELLPKEFGRWAASNGEDDA